MSAGQFSRTKYAASYGAGTAIHPIRVQPETALATIGAVGNTAPTGAVTSPIRASVRGSKRSNRLVARRIRIELVGDPPAAYDVNSITEIPCLNAAFYTAAIDRATVNYLTTTWQVIGRYAESPT